MQRLACRRNLEKFGVLSQRTTGSLKRRAEEFTPPMNLCPVETVLVCSDGNKDSLETRAKGHSFYSLSKNVS